MRIFEIDDFQNEDIAIAFVKRMCQLWLTATKGEMVYRGMKNKDDTPFVLHPRTDRRPLDATPAKHAALNAMFASINSPVNRDNAMFVTPSSEDASHYGEVYIMFPVGQFEYAWSPTIFDTASMSIVRMADYMHGDDRSAHITIPAPGTIAPINWKTSPSNPKSYDPKRVGDLFWVNKGLERAVLSNHEILVKCEKAVAIPMSARAEVRRVVGNPI